MYNKIQIFKHEQFGEIRTMMNEKGEPFFVGKDVAKVLGYSNSRKALQDHVEQEDREDGVTIRDSIGRRQKATFINESGLYSLILQSKLPQARAFKRWVTSEVLPQIRKTGGYIPTKDSEGAELSAAEILQRAHAIVGRTLTLLNAPADNCLTATQVEHVHEWCDERRAIAQFNDEDQADWLLIKRVPYYGLNISAPYVDMRHWEEREQTGTYQIDDTDRRLCDLVLDIQYRTQLHWFYDLHRMYYDNQLREAAQQRRRSNKYKECFRLLPEEFTLEKFIQVFGYANSNSGQKPLERLIADKALKRTKRGSYKKLVAEL